jgi:hypothetical protein
MASLVRTKSRAKTFRRAAVSEPVNGLRALRLASPTRCDLYYVRQLEADFGGRAFSLEKADGTDTYHVHLAGHGEHASCECLGFLRWHHCKHLESLVALVEGGAL